MPVKSGLRSNSGLQSSIKYDSSPIWASDKRLLRRGNSRIRYESSYPWKLRKTPDLARKSDVPIEKSEPLVRNLGTTGNRNQWLLNQRFTLPWSHYQILTHVKDSDARSFYEIEAFKQQWSKRQLLWPICKGRFWKAYHRNSSLWAQEWCPCRTHVAKGCQHLCPAICTLSAWQGSASAETAWMDCRI